MITKILISWLKKNKVQLETEHTAWKFNVVLVLESLLGSFCASVGLNMVLDYFVFHRVDNFNIFGLVTLLYGIANMKILFDLFNKLFISNLFPFGFITEPLETEIPTPLSLISTPVFEVKFTLL